MSHSNKRSVLRIALIISIVIIAMIAASASSHAASKKYWSKINKQKGVTTAYQYKGGKWKPIRSMLCSVGRYELPTPSGTYTIKGKSNWVQMTGPGYSTYVRYPMRFVGQYYLHSACYKSVNKSKARSSNLNHLGGHGTHGCVRYCVMDATWIYKHCPVGTKITIYSSSKASPLGKPKRNKAKKGTSYYWDPTDPDPRNPRFRMQKAQITVKKANTIPVGAKYSLKSGVKVFNPNANEDITRTLKVKKLTRNGKEIKVSSFNTKKPGVYKVTYYSKYKYCTQQGKKGKGVKKTFTFRVVSKNYFSLNVGSADTNLKAGDSVDLLHAVTATNSLKESLTSKVTVCVDGTKVDASGSYTFQEAGTYTVTYSVTDTYLKTTKTKTRTYTVS